MIWILPCFSPQQNLSPSFLCESNIIAFPQRKWQGWYIACPLVSSWDCIYMLPSRRSFRVSTAEREAAGLWLKERSSSESEALLWDRCSYTHCCCCCSWVTSVVSDSVQSHRRQPIRLRRPWDSPGKNTGVGCHFLFQCMKVKSESEVAQSCPTLCNPMDCSLPGSSVHGIFQARVPEWPSPLHSLARINLQEKKWGWKVGIGFVHHLRENLDLHSFNKTLLKI